MKNKLGGHEAILRMQVYLDNVADCSRVLGDVILDAEMMVRHSELGAELSRA